MAISKRNQEWIDIGRQARLQATLEAAKNNTAVLLPESSYNPTAHSYWRQGWNSVTQQELKEFIDEKLHGKTCNKQGAQHLLGIKQRLEDG